MFHHTSKLRRAILLAMTLIVVSVAGASAQSTRELPTNKNEIPIFQKTEHGTRKINYSQLSAQEKRYMDQVIAELRRTDGTGLKPLPAGKLSVKPSGPVPFGCGFNSTKGEPIQFGCWHGGSVCYIGVSTDGSVDGGCHSCNGSNCPTK